MALHSQGVGMKFGFRLNLLRDFLMPLSETWRQTQDMSIAQPNLKHGGKLNDMDPLDNRLLHNQIRNGALE